jgi:hypothetical protein
MTPRRRSGEMLTILGALVASCALASGGCASTSAVRTASATYPPLLASEGVSVFVKEGDVRQPYEVLGILSHTNPGKFRILTLGSVLPTLENHARALGANGIIIDEVVPVKSGIWSTGLFVFARAAFIAGGTCPPSGAIIQVSREET